ncbi:MAG: nicotinate-nucleotide--dimethylbenzimidazole phosphoribosyltransferase [bacterium]|nr:nicotinate-nucleotide--dimethylbenzimidazole phosphoribosyltransferase [bacterium]
MFDFNKYLQEIEAVDASYGSAAQAREDVLTKPQGSLGRLEELAVALASIKREKIPAIKRKAVFTFTGDHGVVAEGVSAFPQEVTVQMVHNFVSEGAAINVLCRHAGAENIVADLGVAGDLNVDCSFFRNKKIARGTKNFTKEAAMSRDEAINAIIAGIEVFEEEHAKEKLDLVGTGEMGIGNTTPATAILAVISELNIEDIVGRGTGVDDDGIIRKITAIKKGIQLNQPNKNDGLDILHKVGGFEIAGLVGLILAAAKNRVPVLIDGFISTSAALIANLLAPNCTDYMLASHVSEERGHKKMLESLNKKPLLDLNLRLGEGTGAALAIPIVEAATKILAEMATFESAGVSDKEL